MVRMVQNEKERAVHMVCREVHSAREGRLQQKDILLFVNIMIFIKGKLSTLEFVYNLCVA